MRNLLTCFRHFVECRRGVTAVEFAFVLPILMFFTVGIMEFSTMFMAQNMLENAVNTASREGKTGFVKTGMSRDAYLLELVQNKIDGLMDPSKVTMESQVYEALDQVGEPEPFTDKVPKNGAYDPGEVFTDMNGNGEWDPDMGTEGLGTHGDVVVYTITYPWQVMTPMIAEIFGNDGIVPLTSRILVKNEPYGNG
jgi:hypothetical protein